MLLAQEGMAEEAKKVSMKALVTTPSQQDYDLVEASHRYTFKQSKGAVALGQQLFSEKRNAPTVLHVQGQPRISELLNAESKEIVIMPEQTLLKHVEEILEKKLE